MMAMMAGTGTAAAEAATYKARRPPFPLKPDELLHWTGRPAE